jgi:rubrerythrin
MPGITLSQAIRNAVETELAAERFYHALAAKTSDPDARQFRLSMADEERDHAADLRMLARRLVDDLPAEADRNVSFIEVAPGWAGHAGMTLAEALHVALEAEQNAALTYDALAGSAQGEVAGFLRGLVETEESHAERIRDALVRFGH